MERRVPRDQDQGIALRCLDMDVLMQPVVRPRTLLFCDPTELPRGKLQPIDIRADVVTSIVVDGTPRIRRDSSRPRDELVRDVRSVEPQPFCIVGTVAAELVP